MAQTKKEKVIQTALKMMAEGGFHDAPMSTLAEKSKVAIGTIYHHFTNKEDLSIAVIDMCLAQRNEALNAAISNGSSPGEIFEDLWTAAFNFFTTYKNEYRFLLQCQNSPALRKLYTASKNQYPATVINFFKSGIKSGKLRDLDPQILFDWTMAGISTAVNSQINTKSKNLNPKQIQEMIQMSWTSIKLKSK